MRKRDAERSARRFVRENYKDLATCFVEVAEEQDGQRGKSWSFGVHIDEEDPRYDPSKTNEYVGYVHADGCVEGLY